MVLWFCVAVGVIVEVVDSLLVVVAVFAVVAFDIIVVVVYARCALVVRG